MVKNISWPTALILVACVAAYVVLRIYKIDIPQVLTDVAFMVGALALALAGKLYQQVTQSTTTVSITKTDTAPVEPEVKP